MIGKRFINRSRKPPISIQYFIGLPKFYEDEPFHHSLMTHFRKRLDESSSTK
ncbi:transposase [Cronobacter sakazakii]|nr:transposase [Cronobacter sakazakii]